ncbi:glycosyltransferase [Vibrio hannami]|uniref:glycosyltransferase n=1 Tax=Vibrio hannami TaxID=2717094 RepID=UPI00240EDBF7|nr:glycosyltransferase [Vibrio hannami]MDG3088277.1 glycosyltransferase [Vibrio hannami]
MKKDNRRHICHLVYSFHAGGLERIIANCINHLDATQFRHTIVALTDVGDFISEINSDVEHYSLNKKRGNDWSLFFKLFQLLQRIKPDVFHSYNLATIEFQWIALLSRVPVRVHAEHGRDSYDPDGKVRKYQLIRKFCSLAIQKIVTVSVDLKKWLLTDVHIPERKLKLVLNGIDTHYFSPGSDMPETGNYPLVTEKNALIRFGHVARLHAIKNQRLLLQAFLKASETSEDFCQNCTLTIVGDGPDREQLEQFVLENPTLAKKVMFTGAKSNIRDYYHSFDVFVMTSIAEGIPMTLLESMSMGLPHVVTCVGGIKEVCRDGITGFAVESEDLNTFAEKLIQIYEDSELRQAMAENARSRVVSHFSQDGMMTAYEELYTGRALL